MALKRLAGQFGKFTIVGGIAFVIDYGLMVLMTSVFGIDYLISTTVSFLVSIIFNYFGSMRFVYVRRPDLSRRREFILFVVLSVIGLVFNDILMYIGTTLIGMPYFITKIVVGVIVALWNFGSRKRFLDRRDVPEDEAAEEASASDGPVAVQDCAAEMPDDAEQAGDFKESSASGAFTCVSAAAENLAGAAVEGLAGVAAGAENLAGAAVEGLAGVAAGAEDVGESEQAGITRPRPA